MSVSLHLGTAVVNTTPQTLPVVTNGMGPGNVAKSVESDLEIRGFTFASGDQAFTLLTCDILYVDAEAAADIESRIRPEAEKYWKKWDFFITASHTHWAPVLFTNSVRVPENPEYRAFFIERATVCAAETFGNMEPVTLELGKTFCRMNINRRAIVNGTSFMQPVHPEFTFAAVDRPVDHEVVVSAARRADGSFKGILVNWNCHPICFPIHYDAVSSCFVGRTMTELRKKYGCVCGYTNAALGNAAPLLGLQGAESKDLVADDLTAKVSALLDSGAMRKNIGDEFSTQRWEVTVKCYPPGMTYCFKQFWGKETAPVPLGMFRIGNWLAGLVPCECFAELAMDFKKRAGVGFAQICSLTNGSSGYMVAKGEFRYGGYEPSVALCAPGEPEKIIDSLLEHIRR
ncbi:MAG: hypothetical protein IJS01_06140 [Lentisphaeria bacterium]|nr:hypothetical protein [Lentisphaeria bacterium]